MIKHNTCDLVLKNDKEYSFSQYCLNKTLLLECSEEDNRIIITEDKVDSNLKIYYYSENKPEVSGNYWRYNDLGIPEFWV